MALSPVSIGVLLAAGVLNGGGVPEGPSVTLPSGAVAIYSLYKIAGSTRACARIVRVTDSATFDVPYGADGYMDTAAIDTFLAGAAGRFSIVYDQSGNNNDATIAGTGQRYSTLSRPHFGFPTINLGGSTSGVEFPNSIVSDRQAFSVLQVLAPFRTNTNENIMQMGKTSGVRPCMFSLGNTGLVSYNDGGSGTVTGGYIQSRPCSHGMVGNASNLIYHVNNATFSRPALSAGTVTGGYSGGIDIAAFTSTSDFMFCAIYPNSSVDMAALKALVHPLFGVLTNLTYNFVFPGDSISASSNSTVGFGYSRIAEKLFNRRVNMTCNGIGGQTAATIYAARAAALLQAVRSGQTNVMVWQPGTNDLATSTSGANLYASYTVAAVAYALANGYSKVFVCTIIPRGTGFDATKETERLAYNQAVRDGAAANNYTVIDFAIDAPFDAVPSYTSDANNTTYYADTIHPVTGGYQVMAERIATVVNAWLPA